MFKNENLTMEINIKDPVDFCLASGNSYPPRPLRQRRASLVVAVVVDIEPVRQRR
jgi:hypothetical protein